MYYFHEGSHISFPSKEAFLIRATVIFRVYKSVDAKQTIFSTVQLSSKRLAFIDLSGIHFSVEETPTSKRELSEVFIHNVYQLNSET